MRRFQIELEIDNENLSNSINLFSELNKILKENKMKLKILKEIDANYIEVK